MKLDMSSSDSWVKFASTAIVILVGGFGAVALERLGSISQELGSLQIQVNQVEEIDEIKERLTRMEEVTKTFDPEQNKAAFAQLSSAKTQRPILGERTVIEMELRDAISNVKFDPRRSASDIEIILPGAYFIIAAPQTDKLGSSDTETNGCYDMWLEVNGRDVANSNVRHCFSQADPKTTDVIVSQGVGCFEPGDKINLIMSSNSEEQGVGIVAIQPPNEPLIPSIIFSMFRVGAC